MIAPFKTLMPSFVDELEKIAAKVPFMHGTNARFPKLKGGVGPLNLKNDPNPQALYTATKRSRKSKAYEGIAAFAHKAVANRGGTAHIATGKMDTKKGWEPFNMKPKSPIDVDEARELTKKLDTTKSKAERGPIWKQLNQHVGSWHNPDRSQELKVHDKNWRELPAQKQRSQAA